MEAPGRQAPLSTCFYYGWDWIVLCRLLLYWSREINCQISLGTRSEATSAEEIEVYFAT